VDHADHVDLIRAGVQVGATRWLEIGAGRGAFTLALADLLGDDGDITAVDRDRAALRDLETSMADRFPGTRLLTLTADFAAPLPFDGILAANALHFDPDPAGVLGGLRALLHGDGRLVVVEYDADLGNPYVPYPLSFGSLAAILARAGFGAPGLIGRVPSRFLGSIYSAVAEVSERGRSGP
jgi:SAM-dependent methyltransferase